MKPSPTRNDAAIARIPESEEGYVLLIAIFFLAILVLSLAVAAPRVAKSIQRDRELETYRRGMQYRRAIQLYYRSFHAYPPNIDALVKTNNIRFLRKRYIDPMTGKDDWKPIMFGQNKTPTAMGFFGQPLAGNASTIAGTGPGGGNSPTSAFGNSPTSAFGNSPSSVFSSSGSTGTAPSPGGPADNSSATTSTSSSSSSSSSSSTSSSSSSSSTGSDTGLSGQTFGGAGIIGYEPASPKQSILIYKKKNHFNEWEFTYDPLSEMQTVGGGNTGAIGQPASSTTTSVGGSPFGSSGSGSSSGSPFGGPGNGPSSSPNPTPSPMPPDTSAPQ